ncbi:hypothetical protein ACT8ZV_18175 [Nocardioides sp. MAHUQ-72]|uniref:hypothetical protein n=1 Tax=unclassified Nocardioides TaxID=2615069 RepID=UPI0036109185
MDHVAVAGSAGSHADLDPVPVASEPTTAAVPRRRSARMVLDVEYPLDETVAALVRSELARGGSVHVVLVHPRSGWSIDPALVRLRQHRIAAARERRLQELAVIAGDGAARVSVSVVRQRWRRPAALGLPEPCLADRRAADRRAQEGDLDR